jgi:alkylmercury lyase
MNAAELTRRIAAHFSQPEQVDHIRSVGTLVRRLAEGVPLARNEAAKLLGQRESELDAHLARLPLRVELDDQGRIVGAGLTLRPTRHRFVINGKQLYTWCAPDALIFPILLHQTAEVNSRCVATGRRVSLAVAPEGILAADPAEIVVSIVAPETSSADLRQSSCLHVNFFVSPDAARAWSSGHPPRAVLNLPEAFELAKNMAQSFGSPTGASAACCSLG